MIIASSLLLIIILGIQQQSVFAENLTNTEDDDSRVDTLYFSIKPLNNWAYANAAYGSLNFFGGSNYAVEMFPNEVLNQSQVYGMVAHDGYYTYKNTKLEHYVNYKKNDPNLKGISDSKLVSQQDFDINGTNNTTKLTYDNPDTQHKYVLYLTGHDKEKYVGYYSAKYDLFDKYLTQFEQMLQTIKWIENT
ncbi:MAG TPA: hypothetical protein VJ697_08065 [Nitrososphaeraceae archaeon]|nr:hypothetical protein [Nitrososphaeraceae archaeon]